jgi:hypothetical protein
MPGEVRADKTAASEEHADAMMVQNILCAHKRRSLRPDRRRKTRFITMMQQKQSKDSCHDPLLPLRPLREDGAIQIGREKNFYISVFSLFLTVSVSLRCRSIRYTAIYTTRDDCKETLPSRRGIVEEGLPGADRAS